MADKRKFFDAVVIQPTRYEKQYRYNLIESDKCPLGFSYCACSSETGLCTRNGKLGLIRCICKQNADLTTNDIAEWDNVVRECGGKNMIQAIMNELRLRMH